VLGLESRVMTLHACEDDLTQDLAELECDAVLQHGSAPWSTAFKQRLEAMLLLATAPPLCLRPTDSTAAVGRLTNAMQYNRLKFNCAELRCAALEAPPLPVRAPRYAEAARLSPPPPAHTPLLPPPQLRRGHPPLPVI